MNPCYYAGWRIFRTVFALYFRWKVYHPERVPKTGPVILAANHTSYLDPPLVGAGCPRQLSILARDTLFRFPVMKQVLNSWGVVPVNREAGAAGLKAIFERLRQDNAILLFPEGRRSPDGKLRPAQSGVGLTVIKSNAPVVPVRVFGTHEAYSRHRRLPLPKQVAVKYGHPMDFSALRAEARTCSKQRLRAIYQQVADELMHEIARLQPCQEIKTFP